MISGSSAHARNISVTDPIVCDTNVATMSGNLGLVLPYTNPSQVFSVDPGSDEAVLELGANRYVQSDLNFDTARPHEPVWTPFPHSPQEGVAVNDMTSGIHETARRRTWVRSCGTARVASSIPTNPIVAPTPVRFGVIICTEAPLSTVNITHQASDSAHSLKAPPLRVTK